MSRLRREDVIEAASRLFAVHGYHGTSMRDLGTELGILGGSVYAHVSSKEELLVEVVHRAGRLFGEAAARAMTGSRTPTDQLKGLIAGHIGIVLNHRDEVQTFLNEAAALDGAHRDEIVAERDRYEAVFRSVIKAGVADGTFRADLDIELATIFVLSILNAIERWYRPDGRVDQASLAGEIYRFATTGISQGPETVDLPE